jgi:rare lipoprotein A
MNYFGKRPSPPRPADLGARRPERPRSGGAAEIPRRDSSWTPGRCLYFVHAPCYQLRMVGLCGASLVILLGGLSAAIAGEAETGNAAYYRGKRTASGEAGSSTGFTAAHRTLPFGTQVRVTNLRNGRSVVVRINDRGPFGRGRIIDVSRAAARELDMIGSGIAKVRVDPQ